ncbi:MAG: carboxyl-terminal processing protease [Parcubacteria group bacterium Gr01-1014_3]|nr:MAG: carboxyl-terminal processing protease [Parcubacteria group bacterium Gr01-1014_3]
MQKIKRYLLSILISLPLIACGQSCNNNVVKLNSTEVDVDIFEKAYEEVYKHYYDPAQLSHVKLFNAAIAELGKELKSKSFEPKTIPAGVDYYAALKILISELDRAKALLSTTKEKNELSFTAVSAMLDSLDDSHTYFVIPERYQEYKNRKTGKSTHSGVGVTLRRLEKDFYYFDSIFEGGPAAIAGLKRFDRLIAVDDKKISDKFEEIVVMVRGPPGTTVKLTVLRNKEELSFNVIRANVRAAAADYRIIQDGEKSFGYFRIYGFEDTESYVKLLEFRDKFREAKVDALIIDVRSNPGGSIRSLNAFLDFFLPAGAETFQEKGRGRSHMNGTFSGAQTDLPVVIIQNNDSGSASEVFAAVMQEQGRATVIGENSSGSVSAGIVRPLPYGAAMMVTVYQIFTAKGVKLEKVGVKPDIEAKLSKEAIESGKDTQLDEAIKKIGSR